MHYLPTEAASVLFSVRDNESGILCANSALSTKRKWVLTFGGRGWREEALEGSWEMEVGGQQRAGRKWSASHETKRDAGIQYFIQLGSWSQFLRLLSFSKVGISEIFFRIKGTPRNGICGWRRIFVKYYIIYYLPYSFVKLLYYKKVLLREGSFVVKFRLWAL